MSGLLGIGGSNAGTDTQLDGYRVQTSIFGTGIPILLGTSRLTGNVIEVWNWQSGPADGKTGFSKGSGKGGNYTYTASFIISYCQGNIQGQPVVGILRAWQDKTEIEQGGHWSFFANGALGQAVWGYLLSTPSIALAYSEECYVGFQNISLGTSGNISNYSFELQGPCCFTPFGLLDALCSDAIFVILADFHCMNFPLSQIGDMTQVISYCLAFGMTVSPVINQQDTAQTILQELLMVANADLFSSGGQIKVGSYGDKATTNNSYTPAGGWGSGAGGIANLASGGVGSVTITSPGSYIAPPIVTFTGGVGAGGATGVALLGNAVGYKPVVGVQIIDPGQYTGAPTVVFTTPTNATFTPDLTPIYDLDLDAFIVSDKNADPVTFSIDPVQDANNYVSFEWTNRGREYNLETVNDSDSDAISKYGQTVGSVQTIHSVANALVANQVASVQLKRGIYYLRKAQCTLGWEYSLLEPMDLVTVPEQYPSLGTVGVRILSIQEDEKGNLQMEGEVLPFPILNPSTYAKQVSGGFTPGYGTDQGFTIPPVFLELPPQLSNAYNPTHLILSISVGGSANWGGCNVYVSTTGESGPYTLVGIQKNSSVMGFLTASYPFGADPDTANLLQVNLQPSFGELDPGNSSQSSADNFTTLALIDQEIISYANVNLIGPNEYSFETSGGAIYNRRGVFGSDETAHANGAAFSIIGDGNQFEYEYTPQDIGTNLWFKFPSFNMAGQLLQDLSDAIAYPWTLSAPFVRGPLAVKPFADSYAYAPSGYSPHLSQLSNGGATIEVSATPIANQFSNTVVAPTIAPAATVTPTGGFLPQGPFIAQVFAVDAGNNYSMGSNLTEFTTTNITSTITFACSLPASTSFYEVFAGVDIDHLFGQGRTSGAPTSITLSTITQAGYGPPDGRAVSWHARAKRVIHGGIAATNVSSSTSTTVVIGIPSAATSNEFAGRSLIAVSNYTLPSSQSFSVIPITASDTGSPLCTLTVVSPQGLTVGQNDLVMLTMQATSAPTATSITDSGLVSPFATSGLTVDAEVNFILRVLNDPTGSAIAGDWVTIKANSATTFTTTAWVRVPGIGTVFIEEEAGWRADNITTANSNLVEPTITNPLPVISLPSLPFQGYVTLVELLTQDSNGNDSDEVGDGFRMLYILPEPTQYVAVTSTTYSDTNANMQSSSVALLRYLPSTGYWEQSSSVSAGARVWGPLVGSSGGIAVTIFSQTLSGSSSVINPSAPVSNGLQLLVILTQSSGGNNAITWGANVDPSTLTNINLSANAVTKILFVSVGGVWTDVGFVL